MKLEQWGEIEPAKKIELRKPWIIGGTKQLEKCKRVRECLV